MTGPFDRAALSLLWRRVLRRMLAISSPIRRLLGPAVARMPAFRPISEFKGAPGAAEPFRLPASARSDPRASGQRGPLSGDLLLQSRNLGSPAALEAQLCDHGPKGVEVQKPPTDVRPENGSIERGSVRIRRESANVSVTRMAAPLIPQAGGIASSEVLGYLYNKDGLNNQKLSLLGLFMAAKATGASLRLPDLRVYDQLNPDRRVVPLGSAYSIVRLHEFAERHAIRIVSGPPQGEVASPRFFWEATNHIIKHQENGGIRTKDFACGFFRHFVADVRKSRLMRRLSAKVFAERGITVVAQLRIEKDWIKHMSLIDPATANQISEDNTPSFQEIIGKVVNSLPEAAHGLYITCDEAALPAPKDEIRTTIKRIYGIELWWKSDFLERSEQTSMNALDLSILDFELAISAPTFVGTTRSSFANMVSFELFCRKRTAVRSHYIYNMPGPRLALRTDNGALHRVRAAAKAV